MSYPQKILKKLPQLTKPLRKPYGNRPFNVTFPNKYFALYIPSVLERTKKVIFEVPLEMTKPEIKRYLQTYYDLEITDIHTSIKKGGQYRTRRGKLRKEADVKKAYVFLKDYVEFEWDEKVKNEILRHLNPKLNKELLKKEREEKLKELHKQQQAMAEQAQKAEQAEQAEQAQQTEQTSEQTEETNATQQQEVQNEEKQTTQNVNEQK